MISSNELNIILQLIFILIACGFVIYNSYLSRRRARDYYEKIDEKISRLSNSNLETSYRIENIEHTISNSFAKLQNEVHEQNPKQYFESQIEKVSQTLYISYKTLEVGELSEILRLYNDLYSVILSAAVENDSSIEHYFQSNPEDILSIYSVHTGNSITFKTVPGWIPKIGIAKGDFQVGIPKKYVALVFTGIVLGGVFSYGLSVYKDILDIENKQLENEKLREELDELKNRKIDLSTENKVNQILSELKQKTTNNPNINYVQINQPQLTIYN